jgi:tetratricopeptide (TPR) repeat protein
MTRWHAEKLGFGGHLAASAVVLCLLFTLAEASPIKLLPNQVPQEKLNRAIAELGRGNLKRADALFQEILKDDPSQVYALLGHAQIAVSQRQLAEADRAVNAVLSRQDKLPEAHNMKGVVLLLQGRTDEARKEFARAIELRPQYVTPRIYTAAIARSKGDYRLAAQEYKLLTDVAPRLPAGYIGQAEAQLMLQNVGEAFRILEAWKGVPGAGVTPYQVIANVHLARGNTQQAVQELTAALVKAPGDSLTFTSLGDAYVAAGDSRSAIQQYEAALKADRSNVAAALRLGDRWHAAGQTARALEYYRAALSAAPEDPIASNNVAWLLAEDGKQLDEALRLATTAVTASSTYVDAYDTKGWIHFRRGEFKQAIESLKKAKELSKGRPDISAHLGLAYAKAGLKQEALAELRQALRAGKEVPNRAEVERVAIELGASQR